MRVESVGEHPDSIGNGHNAIGESRLQVTERDGPVSELSVVQQALVLGGVDVLGNPPAEHRGGAVIAVGRGQLVCCEPRVLPTDPIEGGHQTREDVLVYRPVEGEGSDGIEEAGQAWMCHFGSSP